MTSNAEATTNNPGNWVVEIMKLELQILWWERVMVEIIMKNVIMLK